jgi:Acetoacetate decarboxylase (ADC)
MLIPHRLKRQKGRYALVDGVPFALPVDSAKTRALMAAFPIDADRAAQLLEGIEVHPARLWRRGLLLVTVIDYQETDVGKYIEFSLAIACTRGRRPAVRFLPFLLRRAFGFGQYVVDLPVSTEISVKGGKGIWGMPKHRASLDFLVDDRQASSQYDLDDKLVVRVDVDRKRFERLPVRIAAANYCAFRGMLMKSYVYMMGRAGIGIGRGARAQLTLGDHPRAAQLKTLNARPRPLFTAYFPDGTGLLDDYFESWFLSYDRPPERQPEGFESVIDLGLGEDWPEPPRRGAA